MIKTAIGNDIDYETLKTAFNKAIDEQINLNYPLNIDCFKEKKFLIISINDLEKDTVSKVINLIQLVINDYQIIDKFLVRSASNTDKIYFASNKNNNDMLKENQPSLKDSKKYDSSNFSVSFVLFIFGFISLGIIGGIYFFTRPCVLGNCELITTTENSVSSLLQSQSKEDLTDIKIRELQSGLIKAINDLKRIPFWSKSYENSSLLIKDYQEQVSQLDDLLVALNSVNTAQTLSQNLPLSLDEWNRVKSFFQEAIAIFNNLNIEELNTIKQDKLAIYNNQLKVIDRAILQEQKADELLNKGKTMATEIENLQTQVTDLSGLENLQKNWQLAIKTIESIPAQTTAYQEKEEFLNNYLQKLILVQNKVNQEKTALNIKNQAQEKIKLAKESEKNNQWTKAVSLWEEAISLFKKIPPEVLVKKEIIDLESKTNKELAKAKSELKQAVIREEIKQELKNICKNTEEICTFNISKGNVKVFLTDKYLQKIASLSAVTKLTNNNEQEKQIANHINQVEKNYQYISTKYKTPVEIYNPQRQLIMIYNPPI
jgi:tetratricopeptide (TPR) repeat protein